MKLIEDTLNLIVLTVALTLITGLWLFSLLNIYSLLILTGQAL